MDASEETITAPMVMDNDNNEQSPQETQEIPQETQPSDETDGPQSQGTKNLWGYLLPCNPNSKLERIEFQKGDILIKIGRDRKVNDWLLPGFKISNQHCVIKYDGSKKDNECVLVIDKSTNGTFVNGHKIGKGNTRILREGNEIAFGTLSSPEAKEDYRFIFRHLAKTGPEEALYQYYDLAHELGKGSFANVVKAIHKATGKWFAVKMIQESRRTGREPTDTAGPRKEIKREIEIMKSLEHPNVCKLQDVFYMKNNDISLVLELVEGGDLLEYILTRHGVSEEVTQHITYQLCDALAYVHSKGIAHRDLKPENVLLTNDNPPNVKVADFGLAKTADSLTMLKTMCGTPAYLAPEVVRQQNNEGYDNLVDSWSVGVIVFSMLTNCSPFLEDENQRDIRTRISERKVDWDTLRNINSDISPECEDFIRRLLEDDPKTRMKLSESLQHPWLTSYVAIHPTATQASSQAVDDLNATNLVSHDLENLQLNQDHGPGPSQSSQHKRRQLQLTNGSQNEDADENGNGSQSSSIPGLAKTPPREKSSPRRPLGKEASRMLQRRAQVLDEAHENGEHIPEPSPEMIMQAARERFQRKQREGEGDEDEEMNNGANNGNGRRNGDGLDTKGKGKRLRSELSSLSVMDVTEDGSVGSVGAGDEASRVKEESGKDKDVVMGETPAKKGRITRDSSSDEPAPTTKRGRGGATGGRGRKGKAKLSEVSEESGPPPRRSGRNAGK